MPRRGAEPALLSAAAGKRWDHLSRTLQALRGLLCTTLGHQCGPRQQPRPGMSAWPFVVTQASDINRTLGCDSTMGPDMALRSNMGPDVIMASGSSPGHLISLVLDISMTSGNQHHLRQQPTPLTSGWPLVATQVTDTKRRCSSSKVPDMALGSSLCHTFLSLQVGVQAPYICLFLITVLSSVLPLFSMH